MEKAFKLAKDWADVPTDLRDEWPILHRCKKWRIRWNFTGNSYVYLRFEKPGIPDEIEKSFTRWGIAK